MILYMHNLHITQEITVLGINKKTFRQIMLLITFTLVVYWSLNHFNVLAALIKSIINIISPFIVGITIAFIVNVALRLLEKLWDKLLSNKKSPHLHKFKRPLCLVLSLVLVLGLIFAIIFIVVPEFIASVESFVSMLPAYLDNAEKWWNDLSHMLNRFSVVLPEFNIDAEKLIESVGKFVSEKGQMFVNKTINITTSIFSAIFNFVISFAFSIYILAQKESLGIALSKLFRALLGEEKAAKLFAFAELVNKSFTNFVTGQLTEAVIIGFLCFVGMLIFGMPYASAISVLVGFTALIPVFGAFIGTAIGAFLILLVNPIKALWFVVFILVLQQLEGNLIYPKVVGKSVGLPGILVLAAVTIGGNAFGVVGMLLSVPICSIIYTLSTQAIEKRLNS